MVKNKIHPRGKQNLRGLPLKGEVAVAENKQKNMMQFREQISRVLKASLV